MDAARDGDLNGSEPFLEQDRRWPHLERVAVHDVLFRRLIVVRHDQSADPILCEYGLSLDCD